MRLEEVSKRFLPIIAIIVLSIAAFAAIRPTTAATSNPTGLVIPLYTDPSTGTWAAVLNAKISHPNVPMIVVINPNNGPGTYPEPGYLAGVKAFQAVGIIVLGYMATGYAKTYIGLVQHDLYAYWSWYTLDGIMFDEMSDLMMDQGYYATLNAYVKQIGMTYTMGNPGIPVPMGLIGTLDSLAIYESPGYPAISVLSQYSAYSKMDFAAIAIGVPLNTAFLASASPYVGWVWVTNDSLPNPYDSLPSYFTSLVAALDLSVSVGSTTMVTQTATVTTTTTTTVNSISTSTVSVTTTQTQMVYLHPQFFVAVASSTAAKSQFSGMYVTVAQNGTAWKDGFTTFFFVASYGSSYQVCAFDYQTTTFNHWDDGTTNPCRTFYPTQSTLIVAFYNT